MILHYLAFNGVVDLHVVVQQLFVSSPERTFLTRVWVKLKSEVEAVLKCWLGVDVMLLVHMSMEITEKRENISTSVLSARQQLGQYFHVDPSNVVTHSSPVS